MDTEPDGSKRDRLVKALYGESPRAAYWSGRGLVAVIPGPVEKEAVWHAEDEPVDVDLEIGQVIDDCDQEADIPIIK